MTISTLKKSHLFIQKEKDWLWIPSNKRVCDFILMLNDAHVTESNVISGGRQSTQCDIVQSFLV